MSADFTPDQATDEAARHEKALAFALAHLDQHTEAARAMPWWRWLWYFVMDARCGLHSGFPLCCVLAFLWDSYVLNVPPGAWRDAQYPAGWGSIGYVPCLRHAHLIRCGRAVPVATRKCGCARWALGAKFGPSTRLPYHA